MGGGRWSDDAAKHTQTQNKTKTTDQIFTQNTAKQVSPLLAPYGLKFRESCDSPAHPEAVPIAVFFDVTGSMGRIPENLIKERLPTLMDIIIKHGTEHPHILFGAIGDEEDAAPLQIGQFEAAVDEVNQCLSSIWLEGMGGGNREEAYLLAWLFAGRHAKLDSFDKRGQKGFLFTIGDEASHKKIDGQKLRQIMGYEDATGITDKEVLQEAERLFHIFHIHCEQGSYPSASNSDIANYWKEILPERVIFMEDYTQLAEIIGTTVAVMHGADMRKIIDTFDSHTGSNVSHALAKIDLSIIRTEHEEGVVAV